MKKSLSTSNLTLVEDELKIIHKRISLAEKSYANLIKDFTNVTVDLNRVYERNDEMKLSLRNMSAEESPSIKLTLDNVVQSLETVITSLRSHISVIQQSVVPLLTKTAACSKSMREILLECAAAKHKQTIAVQNVKKNKNKRTQSSKEKKLEIQYQKEHLEITKHINHLQEKLKDFEKSKVENMKFWLNSYLHSCLSFHVKAVEGYTKAYQAVRHLDINDHIAQFEQILFPPEQENRVDFVRWNSFSSLS